jgi:hypothetical protein
MALKVELPKPGIDTPIAATGFRRSSRRSVDGSYECSTGGARCFSNSNTIHCERQRRTRVGHIQAWFLGILYLAPFSACNVHVKQLSCVYMYDIFHVDCPSTFGPLSEMSLLPEVLESKSWDRQRH